MYDVNDLLLETEILKCELVSFNESFFWNITKPCRRLIDFFKHFHEKFSLTFLKKIKMSLFWKLRHGDYLPLQAFGVSKKEILKHNEKNNIK